MCRTRRSGKPVCLLRIARVLIWWCWECCTKSLFSVIFWIAFLVYTCHDFLCVSRPLFYHKQSNISVSGQVIKLREVWGSVLDGSYYAGRRYSPTLPFQQWQSFLALLLPALDSFLASCRYAWTCIRDPSVPRAVFCDSVPFHSVSALFPAEGAAAKLAVATPSHFATHRLHLLVRKHSKDAGGAAESIPLGEVVRTLKRALLELITALQKIRIWWRCEWKCEVSRKRGVFVRHVSSPVIKRTTTAKRGRGNRLRAVGSVGGSSPERGMRRCRRFLKRFGSARHGTSSRTLHRLMHLGQRQRADAEERKPKRAVLDKEEWDQVCQRSVGLILLIMSPSTRLQSPMCRLIVQDLIVKFGFTVALLDWTSLRTSFAPTTSALSPQASASSVEHPQSASAKHFAAGHMLLPMAPDKLALGPFKIASDYARKRREQDEDPSSSLSALAQSYDFGGHLSGFRERFMQSAKTIWQTQASRKVRAGPAALSDPASPLKESRAIRKRKRKRLRLTASVGAKILVALISALGRDLPENQPFFVFGHQFGCVPLSMALVELSSQQSVPRVRRRLGSDCPVSAEEVVEGNTSSTEKQRGVETGMWKRLTGVAFIAFPLSLPFLCSGLASSSGLLELAKLTAQSTRFRQSTLKWRGKKSTAARKFLLDGLPMGLLHPLAARLLVNSAGQPPQKTEELVQYLASKYPFEDMLKKIAFPTLIIQALDDPLTPLAAMPVLRVIPVNPFIVFALTQQGGSGYFLTGFPPRPWFTALAGSFAKSLIDHAESFPRRLLTAFLQRKTNSSASTRPSANTVREELDDS